MEVPLHSVVSPSPSAHGLGRTQTKPPRTNKISQKISTLKGIIRIPTRRSSTRDDITITSLAANSPAHIAHSQAMSPTSTASARMHGQHQRSRSIATETQSSLGTPNSIIDVGVGVQARRTKNDPYSRYSSDKMGGGGLKPYMSQPMLGAELSRGTFDEDDDDLDDDGLNQHHNTFSYESGSGSGSSPDHEYPYAVNAAGALTLPMPVPLPSLPTVPSPLQISNSHSHTTTPPHPHPPAMLPANAGSMPTTPGRPLTPSNSAKHGKKFSISSALFNGTHAGFGSMKGSLTPSAAALMQNRNQNQRSTRSNSRPSTSDGFGPRSRMMNDGISAIGNGSESGSGNKPSLLVNKQVYDEVIDIAPAPAPDSTGATRSSEMHGSDMHVHVDGCQRREEGESVGDGDDEDGTSNAPVRSKSTATPIPNQQTVEWTSSTTSSSSQLRPHHSRAPIRALPPLPQPPPPPPLSSLSATASATAFGGNKDSKEDAGGIISTMAGSGDNLNSNDQDEDGDNNAISKACSDFENDEKHSGGGGGSSDPLIHTVAAASLATSALASATTGSVTGATTSTDNMPKETTTTTTTTTIPVPLPLPSMLRMSVSADPSSSYSSSAPRPRHLSSPSPSVPSSSALPHITHPHSFSPPPILTLTTSDGPAVLSSSASNLSPTVARSTSTATKLKRPPPNHRFSLTFSSSTSSMPGGMPILPLPVVPVFQKSGGVGLGVGVGSGGGLEGKEKGNSKAKRLSAMPALHLQGTSRGTRGHEEFDEEEEEEEEGDEDDEDEDGEGSQESGLLDVRDDGLLSRSSFSSEMSMSSDGYSNSNSHETMATLGSRTTMTSSSRDHGDDDEDDDDDTRSIASRSSSYKTALVEQPSAPASTSPSPLPSPGPSSLEPYFGDLTRPPDKRFSRTPLLPTVETGKLELDFSFLDKPPPADVLGKVGGISGKGKGRANNRYTGSGLDRLTEDAGRTPIGKRASTPWASSSSRVGAANANNGSQADYFAQNHQDQHPNQNFREGRSISEKTVKVARNVSPARTPRAEDYYQSMNAPTPTMGSRGYDAGLPVNTMPPMPQRTSEARLSSRLSITQHPGVYKHASRSLIDVHAVEKKEKVEQMVREDEEAEEEDRKRRVKALRMSMKIAVQGTPYENMNGYLAVAAGVRAQELASGANAPSRAGVDSVQINNNVRDPGRTPPHSADAVMSGESEVAVGPESYSASGVIGLGEGKDVGAAGVNRKISMAPPYDALSHPLRRRRSMPTFTATTAPPPYPDFAPHPGSGLKNILILPREDEGKEKLPPYTNDIKLMAIMPRKLEFTRPSIQAKDRKWRRVLCVLEGTVFKVYKAPSGASGVSAIGEWWESKVGVGDVALTAPTTTTSFQTTSAASGHSRRPSGTNPGDFTRGSGEAGVRAAIAAVEQAEREEEIRRERELVRARKSGEVEAAVQMQVDNNSDPDSPVHVEPPALHVQGHHHLQVDYASNEGHLGGGGLIPATKSALNLAVQLLKPGGSSRHGRSSSDVGLSPTRPRSPRSSLNFPRSGRTTPTSSLRSRSPTPSPSVINHSRPSTPATSISMGSTSHSHSHSASSSRSGFRVGAGSMASSSARTNNARQGHSRVNVALTSREKEKEKEKALEPQEADLIKAYTMQNAESGLGSDYLKRKHVIRVRLEGEQFLLQAKDVDSVIAWIEGLQSATNIALDLDERPMPRGPIFPRRRRRRRVQPPTINTNTANIPAANPSPTGQTPVTASHLAAPLTRSARRL